MHAALFSSVTEPSLVVAEILLACHSTSTWRRAQGAGIVRRQFALQTFYGRAIDRLVLTLFSLLCRLVAPPKFSLIAKHDYF